MPQTVVVVKEGKTNYYLWLGWGVLIVFIVIALCFSWLFNIIIGFLGIFGYILPVLSFIGVFYGAFKNEKGILILGWILQGIFFIVVIFISNALLSAFFGPVGSLFGL